MSSLSRWLALTALFVLDAVAQYNEAEAQTLVKYAGAAYCAGSVGNGTENWSCGVCKLVPPLTTTILLDHETDTHGYVGYDKSSDIIYIVFAGTNPHSIQDWIDDFTFVTIPFPPCEDCRIHKGFHDCYMALQKQTLAALNKYRLISPTASVKVTGHSLGAALAMQAVMDLILNQNITIQAVYNFGQPRIGNVAWGKWYGANVASKVPHYRITHFRDVVPQLPPREFGFRHHPNEVWYDRAGTTYQVCDNSGEDPLCSDQYYDFNVTDHFVYAGLDFRMLGCIHPSS